MSFSLDLDNNGLNGVNVSSAFNEQTAVTLFSTATLSSGGGTQSVDRITLLLSGGGAGESLTVGATAAGVTILNNGTASVTITGTNISDAVWNTLLRSITYNNTNELYSTATRSVVVTATDFQNGSITHSASDTLTLNPVNDAPVAAITPSSYSATEKSALTLKGTGLSVSDADSNGGVETVTVSVGEGVLNAAAGTSGVTILSGNGTGTLSISGTIAQLNAFLGNTANGSSLTYLDSLDAPAASTTLTLSVNDGGNTGGSALTGSASTTINIAGVNQAAVVSSADVTLTETNAALSTSGTLSITDVDNPAQFVAQAGTVGSFGIFAITAGGAWSFTASSALDGLNVGQSVTQTFAVSAVDGTPTFVKITINGTNDAAVLSSAVVDLNETNAALSTGGTLTITDVDSPAQFVAQSNIAGPNGLFSITSGGVWSYQANSAFDYLNVGQSVSDTFNVAAVDGTSTTVQVTIHGTNDAAVITGTTSANLTEGNLPSDISTSGLLLVSDVDSPASFVAGSASGSYGTFSIAANGAWTYTASSAHDEFVGGQTYTDAFSVTTADGTPATVTINILGTNDAAIISGTTTFNLTETDSPTDLSTSGTLTVTDPDNAAAFVAGSSVGAYGTFAIAANGAWTYIAMSAHNEFVAGQTYAETFTVAATDGTTQSVLINLHGTDDAPVAVADTLATNEDSAITFTAAQLLGNDTDIDSASLSISSVSSGIGGTAVLNGDGTVTFTPNANFNGAAAFTYTTSDGIAVSAPATVTVNVAAVADPDTFSPNATLNSDSLTPQGNLLVGSGIPGTHFGIATDAADAPGVEIGLQAMLRYSGDVIVDATDASGHTYVVVNGAAGGTPQDNINTAADDGWARWNYTFSINADTDNNGGTLGDFQYRFVVTRTDGTPTEIVNVTLEQALAAGGLNPSQIAAFNAQSIYQDSINLKPILGPAFDPTAAGSYRVEIQATDRGNGSAVLADYINIIVNTPPVANADTLTVDGANTALLEDPVSGYVFTAAQLLGNDTDAQGDTLSVASVGNATNGTVVLNGDGTVTFTPNANYNGAASFTYTASDGRAAAVTAQSNAATVSFTIQPVADNAIITGAEAGDHSVVEAGGVSNATAGDAFASGQLFVTDPDAGEAVFQSPASLAGVYGDFTFNATTGEWTYTLDQTKADPLTAGQHVTDTLVVTSFDGTASETIIVNITGTDDNSVVTSVVVDSDETNAPIVATGTVTLTDVDGGSSIVAQSLVHGTYGDFSIDGSGNWSYTANAPYDSLNVGQTLTDTFPVSASDGSTASVTINILGTNDPAVMTPVVYTLTEGNSAADISVSGQVFAISDVDSSATFQAQTDVVGLYGTFSIGANGAWSYAAASAHNEFIEGQIYNDTFPVTSTDGTASYVTVSITGTNDEPTLVADVASVVQGATVTGNVLSNDTDPDGAALTVTSANQAALGQTLQGLYGTLTLNADGTYSYAASNAAPAGAPVTDTFTYTASDHHGGSDALAITFDDYTPGSINGQNGWSVTGPFDQAVVPNTGGQGFQLTRQVTSGSFGDQTFSPGLGQTAGEPVGGAVTATFEASWTMTPQALASGTDGYIGVSMDNGTGARGNLIRLVNDGSGNWEIHAFDYSEALQDFVDVSLGTLPVGVATKIGFTQTFADGPNNDVWKVYINDSQVYTGHGWEDYFRDWQPQPGDAPIVYDRLLFRASGTAVVGDQGVIIDNVSYTTNQQSTLTVSVQGSNELATIGGDTSGAVVEAGGVANATPGTAFASGTLTVSDPDLGESTFAIQGNLGGAYGTFTFDNNTGVWTYTLDQGLADSLTAGQLVVDTLTVSSIDGQTTQDVTINITGSNDSATITAVGAGSPLVEAGGVANSIAGTAITSGSLSISDVDAGEAVFAAPASLDGIYGTFTFNATTGAWGYTLDQTKADPLAAGQPATDTLTVTSIDGSASYDIVVNITGTNDAAILSSADVAQDETNAPLTFNGTLTNGDVDNAQTFVAQTDVAGNNGTFSVDANGAWTYTANSTFDSLNVGNSVSDTFAVFAADGTETSVKVTINGTNDPAVLSADVANLTETNSATDISTSGQLTISDVDSAQTFVAGATSGLYGSFSVNAAGAWTYTAGSEHNDFVAGTTYTDAFTVAAADGTTTTVTINILGTNDAAILSSANVSQDETDAPLTFNGTLTISDVDNDALFTPQTDVAGDNGTFSIDANGVWTYTANDAFDSLNVGDAVSDTFTVAAVDGTTTTVKVTINGTNDAAVLSSEVKNVDETNAPITTGGTLTISDVDNDALFTPQTNVAGDNGTFSVDANGVWTYTANNAFDSLNVGDSVSDTFTVAAVDGTTTTVKVTINGTNDAAVLSSEVKNVDETNAPITTGGTLTISDVDNPAAFIAGGATGLYGSFSVDAAGAWTYTSGSAHDEFIGGQTYSDAFTVAAADGTTTTVTINILGTNDAAIVSSATVNLTETNQAADISSAGHLTISDVDSPAAFVAQAGTSGLYGTFAIDSAGAWTYTASSPHDEFAAGTTYTDTFNVFAADGTSTAVTINILGTNDVPVVAVNQTGTVAEDAALGTVVVPSLVAIDSDGPVLGQWQIDSGNSDGVFAINAATGQITIAQAGVLDADTIANRVLQVSVSDGIVRSAQQTVSISIADTAPGLRVISPLIVNEGTTAVANLAAGDTTGITYEITAANDGNKFQIDASGNLSFKVAPDYENPTDVGGTLHDNVYRLLVTAFDESGNATARTYNVTVANVDEAPVFTSGTSGTIRENSTVTGYTAAAVDPEHSAVTYGIAGGADAALFSINASTGLLSFAGASGANPIDADHNGTYEVQISATDTTSHAALQTVTFGIDSSILTFTGTPNPDIMSGTTGVDILIGLGSNDTYTVNNSSDVVVEASGGGTDTVYASVDWVATAGSEIEIIRASGAAGLHLTGNEFVNVIYGASGSDVLDGGAGNDILVGSNLGGNTLIGGDGADQILAYGGNNILIGGDGNDVYTSTSATDTITETNANQATGGFDTLYANYNVAHLADNVEQLVLQGAAVSGVANASNNYMSSQTTHGVTMDGGAGSDYINGTAYDDTLIGGIGNDILELLAGGHDTLVFAAGSGADTVYHFDASNGAGADYIDLTGRGFSAASLGNTSASPIWLQANGTAGTIVHIGSDQINLAGVTPGTLTAASFKF